MVGERLHACVLAAAAGRPFVSIEYRPKLRDFADSVGMGEYLVRTDEISSGRLTELVGHLAAAPEPMLSAVGSYRQLLKAASKTIEDAVKA